MHLKFGARGTVDFPHSKAVCYDTERGTAFFVFVGICPFDPPGAIRFGEFRRCITTYNGL